MEYTEDKIEKMSSPISESEEEKCEHAISMISKALKKIDYINDDIKPYNYQGRFYFSNLKQASTQNKIKLLVQGSYANNTNISNKSDVDIAVILESTFTPKFRPNIDGQDYRFTKPTFDVKTLKNEVYDALQTHFNGIGVSYSNKCIKVRENSYRVSADVVPAYRYRDYTNDYNNDYNNYIGGIQIITDRGDYIINYPEQHIEQGFIKNKATKCNFKKCVRIIKCMLEDMKQSNSNNSYIEITSFGLESLLWNVPEYVYTKYNNITDIFDNVIIFLNSDYPNYKHYKEINNIKPFFSKSRNIPSYAKFIIDIDKHFELS